MASKAVTVLNVLVKATTGPMRRGFRKAVQSAKRFKKSMGSIAGQVGKFGAALGGAVVGGLALLTKQAFAAIDAMGKLSSNIGISTKGLAGLHLAAELGGVSTEKMDKALSKMVRGVGQAGQGLSTQVRAFKMLGLTFDELKTMTPEQQFAAISDGMRRLGSDSERAAVAADIFGRSGVDMINILAGGSEALQAASADADAFGLAVSRIEAKQVEDANDAFTRVKRALTGIGRQIAVAVAPMIKHLSDWFTEAAKSGGGIREKVGNALNFVVRMLGNVLDGVDVLRLGFFYMQKGVLKGFEYLFRFMEDGINTMIAAANKLLPEEWEMDKIGVSFADAFASGAEDIDAKIQDILLGPAGEERIKKYLGVVKSESEKAAKAGLELAKMPVVAELAALESKGKAAKTKQAGDATARESAFADLLLRGGRVQTAVASPMEKKQDKTNQLLGDVKELLRAIKQDTWGLA